MLNQFRGWKRWEWLAPSIASVFLILFFGLTALGRWQHDEFYTVTLLREGGIAQMVNRVLFWSPRPVSELPLISYLYLTEWVGRPLIGFALAAIWAFMYGLVLWASLTSGNRRVFPLSLGLIVLFMVIAGRNNSDALFWVQAAFAYAPTIAFAIALCLFAVFKPAAILQVSWTYAILAVSLAFSSESGAFLVFFHALFLTAHLLWREQPLALPPAAWKRLFFIFGSAALVLFMIAYARGSVVQQDQGSHVAQIMSSISRSASLTGFDLVFYGTNTVEGGFRYIGFVPKLLVFIAVAIFACRSDMSRPNGETALVWGLAALFGAFAIAFAGYVKYDTPGAFRQITIMSTFLWTSLIGFAACSGCAARKWINADKRAGHIAPGIFLLLSLAVPGALVVGPVTHDYGIFSDRMATRDVLWQSRHQTVTIRVSPEGRFIGDEKLASDTSAIARSPDGDWAEDSLLDYFNTDRIEVQR